MRNSIAQSFLQWPHFPSLCLTSSLGIPYYNNQNKPTFPPKPPHSNSDSYQNPFMNPLQLLLSQTIEPDHIHFFHYENQTLHLHPKPTTFLHTFTPKTPHSNSDSSANTISFTSHYLSNNLYIILPKPRHLLCQTVIPSFKTHVSIE